MVQTHTSVPCPACRRPLLAGAKACPACGWSSVAQVPQPSAPSTSPSPVVGFRPCPACGSDAVRRVPAVVGAGTWTSHATTAGGYGGHLSDGSDFSGTYAGSMFGGGSTDLASCLAPPRDPHRVYSGWFFIAFLGVFGALAAVGAAVETPEVWPASVLAFVVDGYLWWRFALHQAELAEEKRAYPERMRRWGSLYYCARCDTVYDPASGRTASPHDVGMLVD